MANIHLRLDLSVLQLDRGRSSINLKMHHEFGLTDWWGASLAPPKHNLHMLVFPRQSSGCRGLFDPVGPSGQRSQNLLLPNLQPGLALKMWFYRAHPNIEPLQRN